MAVACKVVVRFAANNYILSTLIKTIKMYRFQQIVIVNKTIFLQQPFSPIHTLVYP